MTTRLGFVLVTLASVAGAVAENSVRSEEVCWDSECSNRGGTLNPVSFDFLQQYQVLHTTSTVRCNSLAVFVQVTNASRWAEMQECVSRVAEAGHDRSIDLYVGLPEENEAISNGVRVMRDAGALAETFVTVVKDRGADIGGWLQQLEQVRKKYDVMLKIHTKTDHGWRRQMLEPLCGSADQVRQILALFDKDAGLGIVGPPKLTWTWATDPRTSFRGYSDLGFRLHNIERAMMRTWRYIYSKEQPFPGREGYADCAGSTFWARAEPLLSDQRLLAAIPRFINMWEDGYTKDCVSGPCRHLYALESVIPTVFRAKYQLSIVEAPKESQNAAARAHQRKALEGFEEIAWTPTEVRNLRWG